MAYIRSFGSSLPERRVTNAALAPLLDCTPEWIVEMSGIEERRYASDEETVATLGTRAALDCLAKAGLTPPDVGLILVASGSSERFCPGPASQIAEQLGLTATPALDIPVASAGSLIALALASQLATQYRRVLVIGAEIMSRRISLTPAGKNTAILFGDGAGACLIDAEAGLLRIADSAIFTDGTAAEILAVKDGLLRMEGQSVILQAARKLPRSISDLLAHNHLSVMAVDVFLLHQANLHLITRVATSLKAPPERFFTNIAHYGNTSSASLLIAADEWQQSLAAEPRGPVIFSAFGAGINWGALLAFPA